jgi:lysophospholipase L1-like esterase
MVGVNDFWTLPFPIDEAQEASPQKSFLARHSLIYRLYYLIRRGHVAEKVEILMDPKGNLAEGARHKARVGDLEFDMGFVKADEGLWGDSAALKVNLHRLIEQARASGSKLYLMTYASKMAFYVPASQAIAEVAVETHTPLIDLAAIFEPICPDGQCPDTLFRDGHPRASGYAIVAEAILERLQEGALP